MEPAILGLVVDSSVLIAAERRNLTAAQAIESLVVATGDVPMVLSSMTVAEMAHGIYRATAPGIAARRRAFLDELRATIPVHSMTAEAAEIVARIGGQQAARGINLPLADLIIGACALELGYAVGTSNLRDFERIPGLTVVRL